MSRQYRSGFRLFFVCILLGMQSGEVLSILISRDDIDGIANCASFSLKLVSTNVGYTVGSCGPEFYNCATSFLFENPDNPYNILLKTFFENTVFGGKIIGGIVGFGTFSMYELNIRESIKEYLTKYTPDCMYEEVCEQVKNFKNQNRASSQNDSHETLKKKIIESIDRALAALDSSGLDESIKKGFIKRFKHLKQIMLLDSPFSEVSFPGEPQSNGAELFKKGDVKASFQDVAGVHAAKEALQSVIAYLKDPSAYLKVGAKPSRGILLFGEPGNGKTLLAKAVAGEAGVSFLSINGANFSNKWLGQTAERVRQLFQKAREVAPCVIFIDEIDAIGKKRGADGNSERENALNALLSEIDGFSSDNDNILVIAATNRPEVLDDALVRAGRFDKKIAVESPDSKTRKEILKIHARSVKLDPDVNIDVLADKTRGFSAASLAELINGAAQFAADKGKATVSMNEFEEYYDTIKVGAENVTLVRTEEERKRTAAHEAGHALATVLLSHTDPLYKVTIVSRGGALGVTWGIPVGDVVSQSEEYLREKIMILLAGRIAEELIFGVESRTTGASSDFESASSIAHNMVCKFGMSPLGPLVLDERKISQKRLEQIDTEKSAILEKCDQHVRQLLKSHADKLKKLADALCRKETLTGKEVYELLEIPLRGDVRF